MDQHVSLKTLTAFLKKYKYVVLVLALGLTLMLIPGKKQVSESPDKAVSEPQQSLEQRLESILSQIDGVGQVRVLLTEDNSGEIIYQTDAVSDRVETVMVGRGSGQQEGLIRDSRAPNYRGAVILCKGADQAAVKLAVVEAVSRVTGLRTDQISVLKMK